MNTIYGMLAVSLRLLLLLLLLLLLPVDSPGGWILENNSHNDLQIKVTRPDLGGKPNSSHQSICRRRRESNELSDSAIARVANHWG
ncbi:hypothetical protein BDV36DRAFT_251870 [Aspergillus pseudocaelatus]|uniref:Uncharacterized protein n=1 Tax=Aspergillus pseudocaelatus TaxID=1825620 RepID=A0ABQ6WRU3_9EURO|nr:hypothetical protein BDV36DRAFT_251870 [Aspergillus pseudocaelatus]